MDITIRPLRKLSDMRGAVDLQKMYWGAQSEAVVPTHVLYSLANHGGHVLAAFDGEYMVGVLIGFLGTDGDAEDRPAMANLQIVSKRMVVHPEYRSAGLGSKLKLAQRDIAIKQGVRLVTWTFDAVLSVNAHLNLHKLGAICPRFLLNYYGTDAESGLSEFGMSDRWWVEWWVTNRRVEERVTGSRAALTLSSYLSAGTPILNPTTCREDGLVMPTDQIDQPVGSLALIEIPPDYRSLRGSDEGLAQAWREHLRVLLPRLTDQGFVATDFLYEEYEGRQRSFYLLSYSAGFEGGKS